MKIQIENLKAQMRGVQLNSYQRALALDEYYKLLDYVKELEQLTIPAVVGRSEQLTAFAEWLEDKGHPIHDMLLQEYIRWCV